MLQLLPFVFLVVPSVMWILVGQLAQSTLTDHLANKNITLLFAHPDDEVMFFGPTIATLTNPALNNTFNLLCVSTGNAEGLGETRVNELHASAEILDLAQNVTVLDDPAFQDSMHVEWNELELADTLEPLLENTDVVITFDSEGVSNHTNHKSCFKASVYWKAHDPDHRHLWVLDSVPVYRKYSFWFDALYSTYVKTPGAALMISTQQQYQFLKKAMTQGHKSQMEWFRYVYLLTSKYMIANELIPIGNPVAE